MELSQIIKTELYKITHRKSSAILLIPALVSAVLSVSAGKGVLTLTTSGSTGTFSCMDFTFMIWTVLNGLGIGTMIFMLFAVMQFSSEIERGQIKILLLRTGRRGSVLIGKFLAVMIMVFVSAVSVIAVTMLCYQLLIAGSELGTGTFSATLEGISNGDMAVSFLLQILTCMFWMTLTFLIGLYTGTFVSFVIAMIGMYLGNYLVSMEHPATHWFAGYQAGELISGKAVTAGELALSIVCTFGAGCVIIFMAALLLQKRDIK